MESLTKQTSPFLSSLRFFSSAMYLQPFKKWKFKMLEERPFVFFCMKPFSSNTLHKVEGSILFGFQHIPLSQHRTVHKIILMIIIPNNTMVYTALYILQLVNLNYHKLITCKGLRYIFNIPLTMTSSNTRHFSSLTFISLLFHCVRRDKEKFSKHNSPPTLQNVVFFDPFFLLLSPPSSFCSLKKSCFLLVKFYTELITARLKSIPIFMSILLYSYAAIFKKHQILINYILHGNMF